MKTDVKSTEKDITTHVVLVTGLVQKGNKFLLAKRSSNDPQAGGDWATPGGKVDMEVGEDIVVKTLQRELEEEVGVKIYPDIKLIKTDAFIRVSGHHVVGLHFLCKYKSGKAKPLEDQEEVRWFTLDKIFRSKEIPSYLKLRLSGLKK